MKTKYLTPRELEDALGIKISYQAKLRMNRKIPFIKIGRRILYNLEDIERWLYEHRVDQLG
ncbi:helix-turn-helix domain-containing protein [Hydrogenimonas sp.]|jgi:excisionase family DNA binding protein|uniref:helix-turn-helix domain-containing protein n=1 Tax=Hydrogenimonas sp. TaxID=2231112 RepID=UPI00260B2DE2|nr:helix-turn-helix domain-containing protein [Hydrogenimonas sp.]